MTSRKWRLFVQLRKCRKALFDMSLTRRIVILTTMFGGFIFMLFGGIAYNILSASNTKFESDKINLYLPTNTDYKILTDSLSHYLKHIETFDLAARLVKFNTHGGRFILEKKMSNYDIIKVLRADSKPVRVMFNSLNNIYDLAGQVSHHIEADSLSILRAVTEYKFLETNHFNKHNILAVFIPNTYEFYWNTSAKKFRRRMLQEYNRFWNVKRTGKADSMGLSKEEVITLASIVQKESNKIDEYPSLAGVYLNRIRKKIKLQADPTVIYALKRKHNDYNMIIRRVLYKDLKIDSPYNTYKVYGLPPGPIITPEIPSIDAVLDYKKHDYIFFIADINRAGYHMFARTLRQHNRNKRHYVRWLNEQNIKR